LQQREFDERDLLRAVRRKVADHLPFVLDARQTCGEVLPELRRIARRR